VKIVGWHSAFAMNATATTTTPQAIAGITSLSVYRRQLGVSKTTLWRYRRNGWLKTINVLGKLYITREAIAEFEAMLCSGELAKEPHGCAALPIAA
jgi:hypothetical protein